MEEGCVKPESKRGLYSKSFRDVREGTNTARPLIVIAAELVM